jgi:hypothetical protein
MEDKRGIKRARSPSAEGSPPHSSIPTPPSASSGSLSPLGSPSEVCSRRPHSLVFERGGCGPPGKSPVVDLSSSSDEEGLIPDTSRDVEFTRRLFDDLNCDVLGPANDGNVIILSDSDEEEDAREEIAATTANVMPFAAMKSPTPTASAGNADEDPKGMQDDNSDDLAPDQEIGNSSSDGDKVGLP